jgi:lipopolysaccharide/colanic/teichoic acid biosynthesis glycosyltransferase
VLIKRVFDFFAALIGLILLLPLFMTAACWIKWDSPGPIFFRQIRVGRDGILFRIFKFRTMAINSEGKGQITIGVDARITNAGHILRKYKLDELPQLLNVLLGDMSLVGPRPEVPRYVSEYPEEAKLIIFSIRPGITDFASIEFKDENAILASSANPEKEYIENILPRKIYHYKKYVRERSFWLDVVLIYRTFQSIMNSKLGK